MGGLEMAPHTPRRSERPGAAGALLDFAWRLECPDSSWTLDGALVDFQARAAMEGATAPKTGLSVLSMRDSGPSVGSISA